MNPHPQPDICVNCAQGRRPVYLPECSQDKVNTEGLDVFPKPNRAGTAGAQMHCWMDGRSSGPGKESTCLGVEETQEKQWKIPAFTQDYSYAQLQMDNV